MKTSETCSCTTANDIQWMQYWESQHSITLSRSVFMSATLCKSSLALKLEPKRLLDKLFIDAATEFFQLHRVFAAFFCSIRFAFLVWRIPWFCLIFSASTGANSVIGSDNFFQRKRSFPHWVSRLFCTIYAAQTVSEPIEHKKSFALGVYTKFYCCNNSRVANIINWQSFLNDSLN